MSTDVVVIGGGPGGAATALFLARKGIASTIVEKERFPRYHIGESLTGECGLCLRELGLTERLQQAQHPVKFGVKVFGPEGKNAFYVPVMKRTAAGLQEASTWQVRRSDFDKMLLGAAVERGAKLVQGRAMAPLLDGNGAVSGVRVQLRDGETREIKSKVLVDASGQTTFLSNAGVAGAKTRGNYDKQMAVFSQVSGAVRDPGKRRDDTLIFYRRKFHWAWFIPLDAELVSVGVTVPGEYFRSRGESTHDFLLRELHGLHPELTRRLPRIELAEEVRAMSNYSYHVREFTGRNYLCVGDSHRFVDPIFSFGVYFSIKEGRFAAEAIASFLRGEGADAANPFAEYERRCESGQDAIQTLIDAFWDHPLPFAFFVHSRYREEFVDLFAGRVYERRPNLGLQALRALKEKNRLAS